MKAADIPDEDALFAVAHIQTEHFFAMIWDVEEVLPGWPQKVLQAKLAKLIKRGLLAGCDCGCRGDYELTAAGELYLAEYGDPRAVETAQTASPGVVRDGRYRGADGWLRP